MMKNNKTDLNSMFKNHIKIYSIICIISSIICFLVFSNYNYELVKILSYIVLINALILLAYIDYKQKIIPNKILMSMIVIRLIFITVEAILYKNMIYSIILSSFLGLVAGGGTFLLAAFIIKNSIGMGDVKLVAVIGLYVGIGDLFSCIILSLLISLIVGVILILSKKINSKDFIPFAPFLMIGTILTLFFRL
jgi:prepilin signal peptidase PulO-like enzyme (type II secretory pathway)